MLVSLSARAFRNLDPLDWSPGPGRHLLLGGNGAGKTSVLEAVYLLATTKSFRTTQIEDCARHGTEGFHLSAEIEDDARVGLEVGWTAGGGKVRAVNGKGTSLAEHLEVLPVVAWEGREAEALTGAPAARRRWLDRGVVGLRPGAISALARYRRALAGKRELLARPRVLAEDPSQLDSWNELLAAAAAEVCTLRAAYAARLAAELVAAVEAAGIGFPEVGLAYRPSPGCALEGEEAIGRKLAAAVGGERRRGAPLVGPQRDDLEVTWAGHPVRGTVSAGERKALSLMLTAAHGRVISAAGREPVYLLDDLDAELAPATLERVWEAFSGVSQLVASSNRPGVWEGLAVERRWGLEEGRLGAA